MRTGHLRSRVVLAAVVAAGAIALASDATAQFWGWDRSGWGGSNNRGGWGSRFRDDGTQDRGFNGDWRRERNGGELDGRSDTERREGVSGYYCVRLCDGYYFPLAKAGGFSEAKVLCAGLCPATATDVYSGRNDAMGEARAQNGKTYSALPVAFSYRKELKPGCGCRSADTQAMSAANDPTLRAGDIVVTDSGPRVFAGSSRVPHPASAFADYRSSRSVSGWLRAQLDAMAKRYYTTRAQAAPRAGAAKKDSDREPASDGRRSRK